jgi:transcription elongation factor Elf1
MLLSELLSSKFHHSDFEVSFQNENRPQILIRLFDDSLGANIIIFPCPLCEKRIIRIKIDKYDNIYNCDGEKMTHLGLVICNKCAQKVQSYEKNTNVDTIFYNKYFELMGFHNWKILAKVTTNG